MKFVIEAVGLKAAGGKELALDLIRHLKGHPAHQFVFAVPDLPEYREAIGEDGRAEWFRDQLGLWERHRILNEVVPGICRREYADALLCLGNFAPRNPSCATVVLLHNPWLVYRPEVAERRRTLRERLIAAYGRKAYRNLHPDIGVVTQTPVMKEHLCERYGIAAERVTIVPNAFSFEKWDEPLRSSIDDGPSGPFTFVCVARYYAHKNLEAIAEAVERLNRYTHQPVRCVITINPEQHPGARRLLKRLQTSSLDAMVQNIGPVPRPRLAEVYRSADALLFPTLLESYSRTYSEAMSFSLPILTSDRDFAHYLCQDAAVYFDPLDPESIAHAMARVMEDRELRQQLVQNGRRALAQSPGWEEIAAQFVAVLERAADYQQFLPWLSCAVSVPQGHASSGEQSQYAGT